jgi:hypothetical protein
MAEAINRHGGDPEVVVLPDLGILATPISRCWT